MRKAACRANIKGSNIMKKYLIAAAIVAAVSPAMAEPMSSKLFYQFYNASVATMDHFNYPAHVYCSSKGCERQRVMPFGYVNGQPGYQILVDFLGDDKTTVIGSIMCRMPADMKIRVCDAPDAVRWTERLNEATNTWEFVATVDP
jgi:hypothetical protein